MNVETFTWRMPLSEVETKPHVVGDLGCPSCCCGLAEPCDECGGVLHAQADEEMEVGDDWEWAHSWRCDRPCACAYCPENEANPSAYRDTP